ncbi:hypothetical protein [Listeria aquatica]|uniref:Uncharacterized protein n=1 Tax=Listeria aquatica FSL S10-1188 TaxID=1265818 RepID=W7ASL5_9LIST|nr:hypothetical protein [Listeria aquatica]EUJ16607.1 hypothetical protein MAQA_15761 [Listeria aquatica FSL S10-1188]
METQEKTLTNREKFRRWQKTKRYHWKQNEYRKIKLYETFSDMKWLLKGFLFFASAFAVLVVSHAYSRWFQGQLEHFGVTNQEFLKLVELFFPAILLCFFTLFLLVALFDDLDDLVIKVFFWPGTVLFLAFSWLIQVDFSFTDHEKLLLNGWFAGVILYALIKIAFISIRKLLIQDVFRKLNQDFYFKVCSQEEWEQSFASFFELESRWKPYIWTIQIERQQTESKMLDFNNIKQNYLSNQGGKLKKWTLFIEVVLHRNDPITLQWEVRGFENRNHDIIFLKDETKIQNLRKWLNRSYIQKEWQRRKKINKEMLGKEFLTLNAHRIRNMPVMKKEFIESNLYNNYGHFYLAKNGYDCSARIKAKLKKDIEHENRE